MNACIVLPTYNEAPNIRNVLKRIFVSTARIPRWSVSVLIVDDNSPDGTASFVKDCQKTYKNLYLLSGEKQGLGVAYIRGFTYALDKLKPDVIFQMDADLSHPPALIRHFLLAYEKGADVIIGSRYVPGGATPDWGLTRKVVSRGGNFFARVVAGIYHVHDCTSGYRCISAKLLRRVDLDGLGVKGYCFQMNLLFELIRQKAKIVELPLVFPDRKHGRSKMKTSDLAEFFINAIKLGVRSRRRFLTFCVVGGVGVIVNMGVLAALTELAHINYMISSLISIEVSIINNFFLNNAWTFRHSTNESSTLAKLSKFNAVSIVGAAINWGVLVVLTEGAGYYYLLSNLVGILVATAWNYGANKSYTWRDRP